MAFLMYLTLGYRPSSVLEISQGYLEFCMPQYEPMLVVQESRPMEEEAYFQSLANFVGKVRGELFSPVRARELTFKDVAQNVEVGLQSPVF